MKRRRLKKKPFILLVFCIVILFLFTFNVTSSRYMGQLEGEVEDIVAIPIISLDNPTFNYTKGTANMLPGDIDESDFYVTNYDKMNKNEVLMKYYLQIQLDSEIPVQVTLTDEAGTEIVLTSGKTKEYELPYNTDMKTKYHIKIEWKKEDNSYKYAGKDINLIIDLIATQVIEE